MSLKIYPVVLELVRRLSPLIRVLRARSSALADQMERALISTQCGRGCLQSGEESAGSLSVSGRFGAGNARLLGNRGGHGLHWAARPGARRAVSSRHRHARTAHRAQALREGSRRCSTPA
jgi:hypothetical protein